MNIKSTLVSCGKRTFQMALPVLALSMTASFASAGEAYKGTLNLPMAARLQDAVLQPGNYTISVETNMAGARFVYLQGEGARMQFLTGPGKDQQVSDRGHLTLVDMGGTFVIKRFDAGSIGKSFTFTTPKGVSEQVRASAQAETSVEVTGTR